MTCKYKVKIKDIQYNYKVQMTDIQSKYKFKVFCTGYDDSEIKDKIDAMYEAWPKASGEGETITLNDTANTTMAIDLKGNTSQEGTPTPETPQDIHVVSGDNSIVVRGKNLFDGILEIGGLNTGDGTNNNTIVNAVRSQNYVPVSQNTTYTLYSVNNYKSFILYYDTTKSFISFVANNVSINTFTTPSNCQYIRFATYISQNVTDTTTKFQLELGSQATTYEPYQGASYPINLGDIELCKIGNYQDTIVKDNGKWYVKKEIGKVILNGSENWNTTAGGTNTNSFSLSMPTLMSATNGYCNNNRYVASGVSKDQELVGINSSTLYFRINKTTAYSLSTFKTWLGENNSIIYAPLSTPTTTEITDTTLISQLEALKEAESYSGQTNISQTNDDKPFILTAKALKDLSNL